MIAQRFPQSNITFEKPEGWTDEQCHAVAGFAGEDTKGRKVVITAWKPSAEELVKLNLGEPLWLIISGKRMVPVILTTNDLWEAS
jgi:hypothetical protein